MSFSATRLTCFALVSALEEDLRAAIEGCLGELTIAESLPSERAAQAQTRRRKAGLAEAQALPALLPYLDFSDSYELLMSRKGDLPPGLSAALRAIAPSVTRVIAIRNRVAHTRPMEIDDSAHLLDVAQRLRVENPEHWSTLSQTMDHLAKDPSYVLGLTIKLTTDPDKGPQHNLPIPDFDETGFFGRQEELRRIKKAIKGAYPVVSILGDGGIGKTSIALKAAYELVEDDTQPFEAIVWVTAKATILTTNEIQRINGAIESSLGLFARAADELGGVRNEDPVGEVLAYLENFRVLLILDNLETVLDARLREFLLDLPMGSKVIITSRIGLGIENPVQLAPLSDDDSARLLNALARIRNVEPLKRLPQRRIETLAQSMTGHPAYIRWFVAGVQAGRRPEELVGNNELLLEFCMSNVYEYLKEDARAAVRCMQVLPGARNQAEFAFLNDFSAAKTQAALLELLTTNFVQMSSLSSGQALDTVYQLSEFAKQYLDKHHPVPQTERDWLLDRSEELRALGSQLTAASSSSPYASETINIRGAGDVHVVRLLRDAMKEAARDPAAALSFCAEAQVLAPSYYEAWRVEARVRALMQDHATAIANFDRALELAPDSAVLMYHYGDFLLNEAGDPRRGRDLLQAAARLDPESPSIAGQIAWAHFCLDDMLAAVVSAGHVLKMKRTNQQESVAACVVALRAATTGLRWWIAPKTYEDASDLLEETLVLVEFVNPTHLRGESFDRLLQLRQLARELADVSEGYTSTKASEYGARITEVQRAVDPSAIGRNTAFLKTLVSDKGFGFLRYNGTDYFFHYRDLVEPKQWEDLSEGVLCAFSPVPRHPKGARAEGVRVLV